MGDSSVFGLFDLGSSRVKWQLRDSRGEVLEAGGGDWADVLLGRCLPEAVPESVTLVAVDGVGSQAVELGRRLYERSPNTNLHHLVPDSTSPCGLRLGYDPRQFGADRYAALLGVRAQTAAAAVVVDAGTAVTIDCIRSDGVHLGGYILPGFRLGRESVRGLFSPALQARVEASSQESAHRAGFEDGPGRDTTSALVTGWTLGLCAAIDALIDRSVRRLDTAPEVWMTGGDAAWISRFLEHACHHDPDLVFAGLWSTVRAGLAESTLRESVGERQPEPRH